MTFQYKISMNFPGNPLTLSDFLNGIWLILLPKSLKCKLIMTIHYKFFLFVKSGIRIILDNVLSGIVQQLSQFGMQGIPISIIFVQ